MAVEALCGSVCKCPVNFGRDPAHYSTPPTSREQEMSAFFFPSVSQRKCLPKGVVRIFIGSHVFGPHSED